MQQEIIDFINSQKVCVLAVEMMDGSPHAATIHFAFDEKSSTFFFETYREYRKAEALYGRKITRASLVIGTHESTKQTIQFDGEARLIEESERKSYDELYLGKFPNKKAKSEDPKFVRFCFSPKWWRYTSWTEAGKKIILSTDK